MKKERLVGSSLFLLCYRPSYAQHHLWRYPLCQGQVASPLRKANTDVLWLGNTSIVGWNNTFYGSSPKLQALFALSQLLCHCFRYINHNLICIVIYSKLVIFTILYWSIATTRVNLYCYCVISSCCTFDYNFPITCV